MERSPLTSAPSAMPSPTLHPLSPLSDDDRTRLAAAIDSYLHWSAAEFAVAHDHFRLIGEDNFRRYLPIADLRIRVHADDTPFDVARPRRGRPRRRLPHRSSAPAGTWPAPRATRSTCSTR